MRLQSRRMEGSHARDGGAEAGPSVAAARGRGVVAAAPAEGGCGPAPPSLATLPPELVLPILKQLDMSSVGQLACTSRALREATSDPEVRTFRVL